MKVKKYDVVDILMICVVALGIGMIGIVAGNFMHIVYVFMKHGLIGVIPVIVPGYEAQVVMSLILYVGMIVFGGWELYKRS